MQVTKTVLKAINFFLYGKRGKVSQCPAGWILVTAGHDLLERENSLSACAQRIRPAHNNNKEGEERQGKTASARRRATAAAVAVAAHGRPWLRGLRPLSSLRRQECIRLNSGPLREWLSVVRVRKCQSLSRAMSRAAVCARCSGCKWSCVLRRGPKSTSTMEVSLERECSALGGLFHQIITDMKVLQARATTSTCLQSTVLSSVRWTFTRITYWL